MVEIIIAEHAGFCFGVKRATEITSKELLDKEKSYYYSLGPLIHNPQVVKKFEEDGLKVINSVEDIEIDRLNSSKIIIRSHGVPKSTVEKMNKIGLEFKDTTCPYVQLIYKKVEEFKIQGYNIIIIGNSSHPEVIGINGWCNNEAYIINSLEEALALPNMDKVCVVSQTTNTKEKFDKLSKVIKEKSNKVEIHNTICNATNLRQEASKNLAADVDVMVVIGGYHSSNTNKLVEISKENCKNVYHIETINELPLKEVSKFNKIGITAGASTPDWIIEEVVRTMNNIKDNEANNETIQEPGIDKEEVEEQEITEEKQDEDKSNNEMMEAIESSFTRIHRGEVLKGEVLFVTKNEVMVNINYKSDGIISKGELSNDEDVNPRDLYNPGDEIDVYVMKLDDGEGNVILSAKRVNEFKNWDKLEELFNNKERVECKVKNIVKGGLIVLINDVDGFMPASHISTSYVEDLEEYKGKTLIAKIIDFDKDKKRVILSRKEVEKEELDNKRKELWATLEVGEIVEGVVQRLTNFGAFVDLGGLDGLVHISDLSWNRIKHPSKVVSIGETIKVKILSLDKEKNRISLSLKETTEEPWIAFSKNANIGDIVEGKIVNLLDFGAFIRLKEGVDGLLHVSEISKDHIDKPSDVLEVGQKLNVKIIDIDGEDKKISLSLKQIEEENEDSEEKEEEIKEELGTTIEDVINKE